MSVQFTVSYKGEKFEVEITREGDLIFIDYDIEYDLTMDEFGEPPTVAATMMKKWREKPCQIICENIGLLRGNLARLAVDWAEHVLPIFEEERDGDLRPRNAIQSAKDCLDGKEGVTPDDLGVFANAASEAAIEAQEEGETELENYGDEGVWGTKAYQVAWWAVEEAAKAAEKAAWAVFGATEPEEPEEPEEPGLYRVLIAEGAAELEAAVSAEEAASWSAWIKWAVAFSDDGEQTEEAAELGLAAKDEGKKAETSWQIRHFVHTVERVRAGKPWPSIEETP